MPRVRKGAARTQQKARLRKMTKGYSKSRTAQRGEMKQAIRSSGWYAYRDRRAKKRNFRALWITRLTAACKMRSTRYSVFMNGLTNAGITLNRKMLSEIAIRDPKTFDAIVQTAVSAARTSSGAKKPVATAA